MRFSVVSTVVAFATIAQAASSNTFINTFANDICISYALAIPACGTSVLLGLASSVGNCGLIDFECQCSVSAQVQALASSPIVAACGGLQSALYVQSAAAQLCSCVAANNMPVSTPATATGSAATAAASGSASAKPTSAGATGNAANAIGGHRDVAGAMAGVGGVMAAMVGVVAYL